MNKDTEMIAATGILLICCCVITSTSGGIYGTISYGGEKWWASRFFLKFYSPSGKNYLINYGSGEISLESIESSDESVKDVISPYISFVSLNLEVFDIFFEQDGPRCTPRIEVDFPVKSAFIRHSLQSFVGPDKQIYTLIYNSVSNITLKSEKPKENSDYLYIKTYGPYSKWEHTYTFTPNGEVADDLTLSPVKTLADRSIQLPNMDAVLLKERNLLLVNFNTPSGSRYLVTKDVNIARDQDELKMDNQSYITFVEPNGKEYDIFFENDGPEYVANLVARHNVIEDENQYRRQTVQLESFVGPNNKRYRIDRNNETGEDFPVLDSSPTPSSDFRLTFSLYKQLYYNHINYIFSDDGKDLHDRVDEYDPVLLNQRPPLSIDEVEVNSEVAKSSSLTFYSPSGKIYYLTPNDTKTSFAVAKGANSLSDSPYISYVLPDGRESKIYYNSCGQLDMKFSPADSTNSPTEYWLLSFVTPDRKYHQMEPRRENDIWISDTIDTKPQPKDPLDESQEEALRIVIESTGRTYNYLFTWNGDNLIEAFDRPKKRVSTQVLKSLIG